MGKKKKKIVKLNDEQYLAYIAGLKNSAESFDKSGGMVPSAVFAVKKENNRENG